MGIFNDSHIFSGFSEVDGTRYRWPCVGCKAPCLGATWDRLAADDSAGGGTLTGVGVAVWWGVCFECRTPYRLYEWASDKSFISCSYDSAKSYLRKGLQAVAELEDPRLTGDWGKVAGKAAHAPSVPSFCSAPVVCTVNTLARHLFRTDSRVCEIVLQRCEGRADRVQEILKVCWALEVALREECIARAKIILAPEQACGR